MQNPSRSSAIVAVLFLAATAEAQSRVPRAKSRLLITNVNVVPLDAERVLENYAVRIEGRRIVALLPSDDPALSSDTTSRRIDGGGRYLLPGLFDAHVHLNEGQEALLDLWLANGVTTVQSMHGSPYVLDLRARVRDGKRLGPRILSTGPTTARERVSTPAQAERHVRHVSHHGYDAIKMYGDGSDSMTRETYRRVVDTAREQGLRVVGHAPRNLPFQVVLEARQHSVDHAEEVVYTYGPFQHLVGPYVDLQFGRTRFADHRELLGPVLDLRVALADEIQALAEALLAKGIALTPTLITFGTIQAMTSDAYLGLLRADERRFEHPIDRLERTPESNRFRSGLWSSELDFMSRWLQRSHELQMAIVGACHARGVPILAGTDSPFELISPGFSLHDELELLVASGLSPYEALRCATLVPARELGVDGDSGTIAVGKRADLVLIDGNPLSDITRSARVAGVVVAGRWLSSAALESRLEELEQTLEAAAAVSELLAEALEAGDVEAVFELYAEAPEGDSVLAEWVEGEVNGLGYRLLRGGRPQAALAVFEANVQNFPAAFNTWDSLAEAHMKLEHHEQAVRSYRRSLELNPENQNARRMLAQIGAD